MYDFMPGDDIAYERCRFVIPDMTIRRLYPWSVTMPAISARFFGGKDIERALVNAFEEWTREDVNGAFWDDQFKEEKWRHGPYTVRKNGDPVGSPRDIYDLGNLYDSGVNSYKYRIVA
jgi:hypothetical protein